MKPTIQPAQYFAIKKQIDNLINTYQSVNDIKVVETFQALTFEKIREILPDQPALVTDLIDYFSSRTVTKAKAERYFEDFKEQVIPFKEPSGKQVEKAFRKVKKLKLPDFAAMDLRENSYIGWNDPGSQKKYLLLYQDQKLTGIRGTLSPNNVKNICTICHKTGNVALFMATTKTGAEGTYTKKGNYICVDSQDCNQKLYDIKLLQDFIQQLQ